MDHLNNISKCNFYLSTNVKNTNLFDICLGKGLWVANDI